MDDIINVLVVMIIFCIIGLIGMGYLSEKFDIQWDDQHDIACNKLGYISYEAGRDYRNGLCLDQEGLYHVVNVECDFWINKCKATEKKFSKS